MKKELSGRSFYLNIPIVHKTFCAYYGKDESFRQLKFLLFDTPRHRIIGVTNKLFLEGTELDKDRVIFLEYDDITEEKLTKELSYLGDKYNLDLFYCIRSRPNRNDKWHVVIPQIVPINVWLGVLFESSTDNKYKGMSMKRGYSVLRWSEKADKGSPVYQKLFVTPTSLDKYKRAQYSCSSWHLIYLKDILNVPDEDIPKTGFLRILKTESELDCYYTGHV